MKTLFLALALLLAPTPAQAVITYYIYFDEAPLSGAFETADWFGTYSTKDDFSALIGDCADPADCTYNVWHDGVFPHDFTHPQAGFHGDILVGDPSFRGDLRYIPLNQLWVTFDNDNDSLERRDGFYSVVAIPEPSMWLLMGLGLIGLAASHHPPRRLIGPPPPAGGAAPVNLKSSPISPAESARL